MLIEFFQDSFLSLKARAVEKDAESSRVVVAKTIPSRLASCVLGMCYCAGICGQSTGQSVVMVICSRLVCVQ